MRVEEYIGRRIREERERQGISQGELGRLLGPLLGKPWSRQAVSTAELGQRAFAAAELVAVAVVTGVSVAQFLEPPPDVRQVEMPTGQLVDAASIAGHELGGDGAALRELAATARSLETTAITTLSTLDKVRATAGSLGAQLEAAAEAAGTDERPTS